MFNIWFWQDSYRNLNWSKYFLPLVEIMFSYTPFFSSGALKHTFLLTWKELTNAKVRVKEMKAFATNKTRTHFLLSLGDKVIMGKLKINTTQWAGDMQISLWHGKEGIKQETDPMNKETCLLRSVSHPNTILSFLFHHKNFKKQ